MAKLCECFQKLLDREHSLIVVEHSLHMMVVADVIHDHRSGPRAAAGTEGGLLSLPQAPRSKSPPVRNRSPANTRPHYRPAGEPPSPALNPGFTALATSGSNSRLKPRPNPGHFRATKPYYIYQRTEAATPPRSAKKASIYAPIPTGVSDGQIQTSPPLLLKEPAGHRQPA